MKIVRVCMDIEVPDSDFRYQTKYINRDPRLWDWDDLIGSYPQIKSVYSAQIMEFEQPALDKR